MRWSLTATVENCAVEYEEFFCPEKVPRTAAGCRWEAPRLGTFKVNFDEASGTGGWGFIFRDCDGAVLGAAAGKICFARDKLHSEALACIYAIKAATDWGMTNLIIESDSQVLVAAINSNDYDLVVHGILFRQIEEDLHVNFFSSPVNFRSRNCNNMADRLAAYDAGLEGDTCVVWQGETPDVVLDLVAQDLLLINGKCCCQVQKKITPHSNHLRH